MKKTKQIYRRVKGTGERPRLNLFRSNKNVFAQIIDDEKGVTLISCSSIKEKSGQNVAAAKEIGKKVAELAKKNKIKSVVFDRGRYTYTGRVKAFADGAREGGLEF